MSNPVVSVIVPCYNSFGYMEKCLTSLEEQTFKNFEVILVDDCSTDGTFDKLLEYSKTGPLCAVVVSTEKNSGPGVSRNLGMKYARGEWVTFCDSDDWYTPDRLQKMIDAADGADCVLCNYDKVYSSMGESSVDYISAIENAEDRNDLIANAVIAFWSCMIKKEIAERYPIAELYNGEDYATMPIWLQSAERIAFVKDSLYKYYMRTGSLSHNPSPRAYLNLKTAFEQMWSKSLPEYTPSVEFLGAYHILYGGVLLALKSGIQMSEIKAYAEDFKKRFPNWYNNKYLRTLPLAKRAFLAAVKNKMFWLTRLITSVHTLMIKLK